MLRFMNWIKRPIVAAILLLGVVITGGVSADELGAALRSGAVGETTRGYIAAVSRANNATNRLINAINAKRRNKYKSLAAKHKTSLNKIEAVVGKRLIQRAPAGAYVQNSGGRWVRK